MRTILRILWILLSIIGIILAVILLLLFLLLFVPIRYRAVGWKKEDTYVKGQISWLLHFFHVSFLYEKKKFLLVFRILGIPIRRISTPEEAAAETVEKTEKKAEVVAMEWQPEETPEEKQPIEEEPPLEERKEEKAPKSKRKKRNIAGTVELLKQFWQENKAAFRFLFQKVAAMGRALLPKKVKGTIWFGTGDPATTGELTGALAVLYGFYGNTLNLYPDFTRAIFMGELFIVGRIRLFTFLRICITVVMDKNVRRLIKNMKNLKEGL